MTSPSRTTPTARHRTRRLAALAAAGAVVLAGCGGDDVDDVASSAEELAEDAADTLDESAEELDDQTATVVTALEDAGLSTLASAVSEVDITEIAGSDEFTFFAPNDDAFLAMTADDLADLTADPELLSSTLQAHIVDEPISADELGGMEEVTTVGGTTLDVATDGDEVTVGGATVVETDIQAGDGVVHVIDTLLGAE